MDDVKPGETPKTLKITKMTDIGYVEGTYARLEEQLREAFESRQPGEDPNSFNIRVIDFEKRVGK